MVKHEINLGLFVGHSILRNLVGDFNKYSAVDEKSLKQMQTLCGELLDSGCFRIYYSCIYFLQLCYIVIPANEVSTMIESGSISLGNEVASRLMGNYGHWIVLVFSPVCMDIKDLRVSRVRILHGSLKESLANCKASYFYKLYDYSFLRTIWECSKCLVKIIVKFFLYL